MRKLLLLLMVSFCLSCSLRKLQAHHAPTKPQRQIEQADASEQSMRDWLSYFRNIYFNTGSDYLRPLFYARLKVIAKAMRLRPEYRFTIVGHADYRGDEQDNWELGMRRAKAVQDHLISLGIERDRLYVTSKGAREPKVKYQDPTYLQINRRVEFRERPPVGGGLVY